MEPLYLAVDAGGTRTSYVLASATEVMARTTSGSIKRMRVSAEEAERHLDEALANLELQTGRNVSGVSRTCVGIAGQTVPVVHDWVEAAFHERVGGELLIGGDVDIALDAAFRDERGVLVLAGTGSNVLARSGDGTVFNVGGWGPALGDQGSGYWIGRQALAAAFQAVNEGRSSRLLEQVLDLWEAESLEDIVARAHGVPPPDFAALSRVVAVLAEEGDPDCREVLLQGGDELAAQVRAALRRIHADEVLSQDAGFGLPAWQPPALACAGSVLEHIPLVRDAMLSRLRQSFPHIEVLAGVVDPVMGALWRARTD